jgi:hypothetical protein
MAQVVRLLCSVCLSWRSFLTYILATPVADLEVDPVDMPAINQVSAKGYRVVCILQSFSVFKLCV